VVQPGGGLLFGVMFGFGLSLTFCRGFEVVVDNVLEPNVLAALAAIQFERRGKLLLLNKPINVLAGVLDTLRFEVPITDKSTHRDALTWLSASRANVLANVLVCRTLITTNISSLQDTPNKSKKSAIPDFQIFR
jgi:hypothetical protein